MTALLIILLILVLLGGLYLFLIFPRRKDSPDRSHLMGVHYAHRGLFDNHSDAPENSLAAFRKAVEAGYGIELDVQLSRDRVPVVFHDADLKRMCGVEGKVWDYTLSQLQQMKLMESHETIPTFQEVLETVNGQVPLIVEYKMDQPNVRVCRLGDRLLSKYEGPYCIESFHPFALRWYRQNRPDVVRGQLCTDFTKDEKYKGKPLYLVLTYLLLNVIGRPDFIAYDHKYASNLSRRLCRKLGALSVAWTIRSQEEYEAARDEFDLFIFDSFILK